MGPRTEDGVADSGMSDLTGTDIGHADGRRASDDAARCLRDRVRIPEPVLECHKRGPIREALQSEHRVRRVIRLRRHEDEIGFCVLRYRRRCIGLRDHGCLPHDAKSVRANCIDVFRSSDQHDVVSAREQSTDETAHRARSEHENFHGSPE